jgi:glycosyltransferase involved in cell wall biosynthesis
MNAPVSTIIPCYRCALTIARAVESVARQTLVPTEVILVDDVSDDGTLDTLHALQRQYGLQWLKVISLNRNSGPSVARNAAWDAASSECVAFLDADDTWHPQKVALQYAWMRNNPDSWVSDHKYEILDPTDSPGIQPISGQLRAHRVARNRLLLSNPFVTPSIMLRRDLAYRFDPTRGFCEDYLLWLQLRLDGIALAWLDATLVYVFKRIGASGASRHLLRMRLGDIDNHWQLWRSRRLGLFATGALSLYSVFKFMVLLAFGPQGHFAMKRRIEGEWLG